MKLEQAVFESCCIAWPSEMYATYPERFWAFFHKQFPLIPKAKMEEWLHENT